MELKDAMKKIEGDNALKLKFYENPTTVLNGLGVNTSGLKITKSSQEEAAMLKMSVCVSVVEFVGASVGT